MSEFRRICTGRRSYTVCSHDMSLNSVVEQALQHMVEEQLHQSALFAQENGERSMAA